MRSRPGKSLRLVGLGVLFAAGASFGLTGGELEVNPAVPGNRLGSAIATAEESALVGAPGSARLSDRAGSIEVFRKVGEGAGSWVHTDTLIVPPGTLSTDGFGARLGHSLASDGDLAVAGAPGMPGSGYFNSPLMDSETGELEEPPIHP